MRTVSQGGSRIRCAFLVGALGLTGCVPGGFVYDLPQDPYDPGGTTYYSSAQSGYYGQPVYYGQSRHGPQVVYVDHDHDRGDCRHESHRERRPGDDRRRDRDERDTRDAPAVTPPPRRAPRGVRPQEAGDATQVDATRRRTETPERIRVRRHFEKSEV
jgi:hypothetical protein